MTGEGTPLDSRRAPRAAPRPALAEWGAAGALGALHLAPVALSLALPALLVAESLRGEGEALGAWRATLGDLPRWGALLTASGRALLVAALVQVLLGAPLAFALVRTSLPGRRAALLALLLLALLPGWATGPAAAAALGAERLAGSPEAVGLVHGLAGLPLATLIIGLAVWIVPAAREEGALLEGWSEARTLLRVTLPAAAGGLATAGVLAALGVTTDYSVSDLLLVRTFAREVYTRFALAGNVAEPIIVGLPVLAVFTVLLLAAGRLWPGLEPEGAGRAGRMVDPGRLRAPIAVLAWAVVAGLILLPASVLLAQIEWTRGPLYYLAEFAPELRTSAWTAGAAGAICAGLAPGLARSLARGPRRRRFPLFLWLAAALALPPPLLAIALIRLLNRPGALGALYDSPLVLVIAWTLRFLPVAVLIVLPAAHALPSGLVDTARSEGCGAAGVWRRVLLPWCARPAIAAWLVVTALAAGELPAAHLLSPPGYGTLGPRYFALIHYGLRGKAAVLGTLGILCVLLPWGLLVGLASRARKDKPS